MRQAEDSAVGAAVSPDAAAIDALVAAFYGLFDNRDGLSPLLDAPTRVFLPEATILRRDGDAYVAMTLDAFLAPRRRWLSDGTLVRFHEWETQASTRLAGGLATRLSRYRKEGLRDGVRVDGEGAKSLHLVLTPGGWRIAHVAWEDGEGHDWRTS